MTLEVCILAAGLGKRMMSDKPKVLHEIAGRPMLDHLLSSVMALGPDRTHVVVGQGADQVKAAFATRQINWVLQPQQRGTGHAVMQVVPHLATTGKVLILLGDAPLVTVATLRRMIEAPCDVGVLTTVVADPFNYGRIIRGSGDALQRIVEERDASPAQRAITEINTGVMIVAAGVLPSLLERLTTGNDQGEYLLTDIVALAAADGLDVRAILTRDEAEVKGVNNPEQLQQLEQEYHRRRAALPKEVRD
jgi:bifunctional UDP-N-acetylglucosamine pyrophosphorylase / glucosamine-1-phosphate N-acetyltransferase